MATESVADLAQSRNKIQPIDTDKVAKLIRLFGSDRDGEVLATVGALKRTLHVAGMDLHDLADAVVAGFRPAKPPERTKREPSPPDLYNWESMCWYCQRGSRYLSDDDRRYIDEVLLEREGFDLGRATPELMRRLRDIVGRVQAARRAQDVW